jgi:hypothetical protein
MKITPAELAEYRQQVEEADLTPEIKEQALIDIAAIEKNGGDIEAAANDILPELADKRSVIETLNWQDIVRDFPEIAGNKQQETERLGNFLIYCKENNCNPHEKSSWSAYMSRENTRTVEGLTPTTEVSQIETVQPKDIGVLPVMPFETNLASTIRNPYYVSKDGRWNRH